MPAPDRSYDHRPMVPPAALPHSAPMPDAQVPGRSVAVPSPATAPAGLVIAGLGHVALGIARDAVAAGREVTCFGPQALQVARLVGGLAGDDALAGALRVALRGGRLVLTDGVLPAPAAGVGTAVLAPAGRDEDPALPGRVEVAAAALAPHLRPGSLVVVAGRARLREHGDIVAGTIGLLTGLSAGRDYALGFAVPQGGCLPRATVVSGVDTASARATEDLFRALGRGTLRIAPVEAAEFVAHLRDALGRRAPALACTSVRR
jgi:UDP-N-acetyl-D-glucosamine dehydrogenase